ncbi:phosphotransferase enzyme family-domain-containing protein [Nemania diffusa]|nr:phosphotransferase enzyme family-domain-containing protein [Nemania diffusa]
MTGLQEEGRQLQRSPSFDSLFDEDPEDSSRSQQLLRSPSCDSLFDEELQRNAFPSPPAWLEEDPACGLAWRKNGLSVDAAWTVEPTIESIIATLKVKVGLNHDYNVQFLHEGAFTKLYTVSFDNQAFVMRVSLPVCPRTKTEAEVATLDWVRLHTRLRVPHVKAYDSSRNNPLGFEWVLMEKLHGKPLSQCWSSWTYGLKRRLVRQIADFTAATFNKAFQDGIGSISKAASNSDGRTHDHNRGPFFETSDWVRSRLQFALSDLTSRLSSTTSEAEKEMLHRMVELTRRIERLMPKFISSSDNIASQETTLYTAEEGPALTMLFHDSLSLDNMLVDDQGVLRGVLDWQCIPCVPLQEGCQFPAFLQQKYDRFREPFRRFYLGDEDRPHPAYYKHYNQYELTKLRRYYIAQMLDRERSFMGIWRDKSSADWRDYEAAVQNCDNEFTISAVEKWVEAMERGKNPAQVPKRLHELLMEWD